MNNKGLIDKAIVSIPTLILTATILVIYTGLVLFLTSSGIFSSNIGLDKVSFAESGVLSHTIALNDIGTVSFTEAIALLTFDISHDKNFKEGLIKSLIADGKKDRCVIIYGESDNEDFFTEEIHSLPLIFIQPKKGEGIDFQSIEEPYRKQDLALFYKGKFVDFELDVFGSAGEKTLQLSYYDGRCLHLEK